MTPILAAETTTRPAHPLTPLTDSLVDIWKGFVGHLPHLAGGLVVIFATWVVAAVFRKAAGRLLHRLDANPSLRVLAERLVLIGIWLAGLMLAAMIVFPGLTPSNALAGLGIGSLAVGFAFKDIFENFFAGILILWRFPFDKGDFIECTGIRGSVEDVTVRNTILRKVSGELVVMPNATIYKNPCYVLTNRTLRRIEVVAGVAYGENVAESREVIRKAVEACETVSDEQPVHVLAEAFADSSINFRVLWWAAPKPLDELRSRDEVVDAIKRALDAAGIEIPFPYRTLTFKEPLTLGQAGEPREQGSLPSGGEQARPGAGKDGADE